MAPPGVEDAHSPRILMLHGFTQSGPLFHAKTGGLEKAVLKAFPGAELLYPTAPVALAASDVPGHEKSGPDEAWGWWRAPHPRGEFVGLEQGLDCIADTLRRHGRIDGVIGFSQGAAMAAIVAALLEPDRRDAFAAAQTDNGDGPGVPFLHTFAHLDHPPLRFVVCYSGFASVHAAYAAFYAPHITTQSLHFIGSLDTVVEESWARELVGCCESGTAEVVVHPGGHFVPAGKRELAVLVSFIRRVYWHEKEKEKERKTHSHSAASRVVGLGEEDVLDMDVPF